MTKIIITCCGWRHGFTNRGPLRFYLELMCVHGWFFDEDPQNPWASVTLNTASLDDQMARSERLAERIHNEGMTRRNERCCTISAHLSVGGDVLAQGLFVQVGALEQNAA